jgi:L-alanine-DL-glutamate epimerase-like enolase superfamily enzyme
MVAFSAARIEMHRLSLPLRTPYKLAMGAVSTFDTILIEAIDSDGRRGWGEATILTGYTDETIEGAWAEAQRLAHLLCISTAGETSLDEAFAKLPSLSVPSGPRWNSLLTLVALQIPARDAFRCSPD